MHETALVIVARYPEAGKTKTGTKRPRKQGVDLQWIQEALGKESMTLQQLQAEAEKQGAPPLTVLLLELRRFCGQARTIPRARYDLFSTAGP